MKNTLFFTTLFLLQQMVISAQGKYDYVWPLGFGDYSDSPSGFDFGGCLMNFDTTPPSITLQNYWGDIPLSAISDKKGNLVAYTDGCRVMNGEHKIMVNGDTLNPGVLYNEACSQFGYPLWQPCIFLPSPASDSFYYLFHIRADDYLWNPMNLMYSVIDIREDQGNGAVISKNNVIFSDSIYLGQYVSATRHANGRDWWLINPTRLYYGFHVTLLSADGVLYKGLQVFDLPIIDSTCCYSQNAFSPDGSKYFRNSVEGLVILNFDRCTGVLSNPASFDWDSLPYAGGGVAVSPNNQWLYLSSGSITRQYDLYATDIVASMQVVAEYDGFQSPFPTGMFQMREGPDGKFYIVPTSESTVLHVIHNPNAPGLACNLEQHGVTLPTRTGFLALNFPNYRLGPLDGSSCDTLGLNNLPVARFQWHIQDSLFPAQIAFYDYSYYEPATWYWDFGDGTSSQDTSPVHLFPAPGTYSVCLTVCNEYACDTLCRKVTVGVSGTTETAAAPPGYQIYPNPTATSFTLRKTSGFFTGGEPVVLYNSTGQVLATRQPVRGETSLVFGVESYPPGVYWLRVEGVVIMVLRY